MSEPARPQRLVFGEVADDYDRVRPALPDALLAQVAERTGLAAGAAVLEVGAGTGKGTVGMARRGWRLTCLEPDAQMAALLRAKGVAEVVISDLEAWDGTPGAFDAVAAVDSWHWLDPEVVAGKVAGLLHPGGWVLVCWNRPDIDGSSLSGPLHEVYAREAPDLLASYEDRAAGLQPNGPVIAQLAATGAFAAPEELRHVWERTYTTQEYVTLLGTHSGHRLLPEPARTRLHTGAGEVIDAAGGTVTIPYHAVALIAQRR